MLFSEIYGSYYNAVSKLIACAVDGDLTKEKMYEIRQIRFCRKRCKYSDCH